MSGIIGRKLGMSQVIAQDGAMMPVTYIEVFPNEVVQVKNAEKDGYTALVLGAFPVARPSKNKKFKTVKEFRFDASEAKVGDKMEVAAFAAIGDKLMITGISKGKGFAGTVKRYNHNTARSSHGQKYTRHGTTMNGKSTAHSHKGIPMPGHLGTDTVTTRDREVLVIDSSRHIIGIKGPIPGAVNGTVFLKK